jgi:hypothetical protein
VFRRRSPESSAPSDDESRGCAAPHPAPASGAPRPGWAGLPSRHSTATGSGMGSTAAGEGPVIHPITAENAARTITQVHALAVALQPVGWSPGGQRCCIAK